MSLQDFYPIVDLLGVSLRYTGENAVAGKFSVAVTPIFDVEFTTVVSYKDKKSGYLFVGFKAGGNLHVCLMTSGDPKLDYYALVVDSSFMNVKFNKWGGESMFKHRDSFNLDRALKALGDSLIKVYSKKPKGAKWDDIPIDVFVEQVGSC